VRIDAYGINMYKSLVIFTGASMSLSAVVIVLWFLLPKKVREVQFGSSPSRN
jgi:hypothetical protein